jgi:uncharacterized protein (DUF885 family)
MRPLIGNRIYGCDDCQTACPWNKFAQRAVLPDFDERHGLGERLAWWSCSHGARKNSTAAWKAVRSAASATNAGCAISRSAWATRRLLAPGAMRPSSRRCWRGATTRRNWCASMSNGRWPVFNQFGGLHVQIVNFLTQAHPIRNQRDIENYLERLKAVSGKMDTGILQSRGAAGRGILMPTFLTQASIGQLDRFLDGAPENNVFVATLVQRMGGLKDVTPEQQAKFAAEATGIVKDSIIPVFQRTRTLLQEQLPRTTNDAGLWRLPKGDKAYAVLLKQMTSTTYTPQQIHDIGLREVARIEKEMDGLLVSLGYKDGTIKQRMEKLEVDSQPKEADPRPALLNRYDEILRDAEARSKELFDATPKAPVVVKREPPFTEKTAAAHYTGPAKDGTRPGIFWAPMPGPEFRIVGMRTLVYHEGVPGHHFQVALQQENEGLPRYRRDRVFSVGSAYGEGWALYAEQLASENNWYGSDVVGHLGQLDAELFRARRLVVDTGLHAMKWTRQQGIDYGIPPAEVDRYVAMPGQACAYKIGMMRILDLRAKAQKALGDQFNIKGFHNVVLETGNVPLPVLEQMVDEWIAKQKAG